MITGFGVGVFCGLMCVFGVRGLLICRNYNKQIREIGESNQKNWNDVSTYWHTHLRQGDEALELLRKLADAANKQVKP
jgi:polyferredoxin